MALPIRTRIALWTTALLAAVIAALGSFLVLRLHADLVGSVDRTLALAASEITVDFRTGAESEFRDVSDQSMAGLDRTRSAAQILSADGTVMDYAALAGSRRPLVGIDAVRRALAGQTVRISGGLSLSGSDFRAFVVPFRGGSTDRVLVVATSLREVDQSVHRLVVLLLVGGPLALLLCGAGGWWLARMSLAPVAAMTKEADRIGAEHLDQRVNVPPAKDELNRLALTLNKMLGRLQGAVEQQRRFTADASHELRTPLAVMRAELSVALETPQTPGVARETLESSYEEVVRMTRLVEDLLVLARMDAGQMRLLPQPVDLSSVAERATTMVAPLAERHGVYIETTARGDGADAVGDRERLTQVLINLLDNAVKHSPKGGVVRVESWHREGEVGITVRDQGPGLPPDAIPHLFERFYRSDGSRASSNGGSGLGLAISREIALAHGGRIWVESEPGRGSAFSFGLPAAKDTPA